MRNLWIAGIVVVAMCWANSAKATLPTITTPPTSQTVLPGSSVSFTVVASGTPTLSYQWKKGDVEIADATLTTYSIASAQESDEARHARGSAADEQPHGLVRRVAGKEAGEAGADRVGGADAVDDENDAADEQREGDEFVHGIVCGRWTESSAIARGRPRWLED